jgi:hypothetical protein
VSFANGISDPDTWWHLAAGEYMVTNNNIPHHDIFSWTVAGEPWITHEWLSEVVFYTFYLAGKFYGVLLVVLSAALLLLLFYWKLLSKAQDSFIVAALTLFVVGILLTPFMEIRPQIFSYLFFVIFLFVLYSFVQGKRDSIFILPFLTVIWANVHGSFFLGPALVLLFLVCGLPRHCDGEGKIAHHPLDNRRITRLGVSLVLCLLAVLINPNALKLLVYPLQTLGDPQMTDNIQEWLSPNFHELYYQIFLAYYLMTFLTLVICRKKILLIDILLFVLFGIAAFLHIRFIAYALLVSSLMWPRYFSFNPGFRINLSRVKTIILPLTVILYGVVLFGKAPPQSAIDHKFTPADDGYFPVEALTYLKANPITGKMLNDYGWGGYLIWNRREEKVFIDGRADVYIKKVFADYRKITKLKPEAADLLADYGIDYVLMPCESPLVQALKFSPDWRVLYEDEKAAILVRNTEVAKS